jgi:hypothetical protein
MLLARSALPTRSIHPSVALTPLHSPGPMAGVLRRSHRGSAAVAGALLAFSLSESTATVWDPAYLEVLGPMGARAKRHQGRRQSSEGTHMDNPARATLEMPGENPARPHVRTCKIDGCGGARRARGWCSIHYCRWQRHGDPLSPIREYIAGTPCSIDGCEGVQIARGWCARHYARWRAHGDPLWVRESSTVGSQCCIEGCDRIIDRGSARGWCGMHYQRWYHHGDPLFLVRQYVLPRRS